MNYCKRNATTIAVAVRFVIVLKITKRTIACINNDVIDGDTSLLYVFHCFFPSHVEFKSIRIRVPTPSVCLCYTQNHKTVVDSHTASGRHSMFKDQSIGPFRTNVYSVVVDSNTTPTQRMTEKLQFYKNFIARTK